MVEGGSEVKEVWLRTLPKAGGKAVGSEQEPGASHLTCVRLGFFTCTQGS